ncbi:MAG: PqqD family protein [Acidobacteria bacterium]|nr:PqqD family protein [Acidobacteriota bacterium]
MERAYRPVARTSGIIEQTLGHEVLLYNMDNDKAYCLNETAALVWKKSDGTRSVAEISSELSEKLGAPVPDSLVEFALSGLVKEDLISPDDAVSRAPSLSRRRLMKELGLATAVAVPVIASLVAPPAADAASCSGVGGPCGPYGGGLSCCSGLSCNGFYCLTF